MLQTVLEVSIPSPGAVLRITQTFSYLQGSFIPWRGMGQWSMHSCKPTTALQHRSSCSGLGNADTVMIIFVWVRLSQGYYKQDGFSPGNGPHEGSPEVIFHTIQEKWKSYSLFCDLLNTTKMSAVPAVLIGMSLQDKEITAMIFWGDSFTAWL